MTHVLKKANQVFPTPALQRIHRFRPVEKEIVNRTKAILPKASVLIAYCIFQLQAENSC